MEFRVFEKLVRECKKQKPILLQLDHDEILSADEITDFENKFQLLLSEKYKYFLMNYGGGFFGYVNVYSLDKSSNFYLLNYNEIPIEQYLRIADNGCGDYYLLRVEEHKCLEQIFFYEHGSKTVCGTEYADILEYLAKAGLKE